LKKVTTNITSVYWPNLQCLLNTAILRTVIVIEKSDYKYYLSLLTWFTMLAKHCYTKNCDCNWKKSNYKYYLSLL